LTFTLDAASTPALSQLDGTIFALAVPIPTGTTPAPSPRAVTPFLVLGAPPASFGLASDVFAVPQATAATTGLVSSSGLTVSLSAADGLRRDGAGRGSTDPAVNPQTITRMVQALFEVRDALVEVFRMFHDHPPPLVAPIDPGQFLDVENRLPDEFQAIPLSGQVAAPPAVDEGTVIGVRAETVAADIKPEAAASAEPVIAHAETHPWWLASYENTPKEPLAAAEPMPEPTTADKAAALVTALWLGGVALRISAPDPPVEDEPPTPRNRAKKGDETKG